MITKLRGLLLVLFIFSLVHGQNIRPELIKGLAQNLEPGTNNTVVFRIFNDYNKLISLDAVINQPENWQVFYNRSIDIESNSVTILPISIIVPQNTPPGLYQLDLEISNKELNYRESLNIDTHILKRIDIDVRVVNAPKIAMAGKEILADFSIYNKSNSPRKIFLESTKGFINGAKNLTLDQGETKIINVFYDTDYEVNQTINKLIDLTASTGPYEASDKVYVTLIPSKKYKTDKYHRLPTSASVMYLHRDYGNYIYDGGQIDIHSYGALNPDGDKYLEFRARGPDQFDNSILGLYDEYYVRYLSKNINIQLGDDNFSLTPLTEYGRYGTGLLAEYSDTTNHFGFFYMQPRFYPDFKEELAAYARYNLDNVNSIGVSFLQKTVKGVEEPVHLYSAQYSINPIEYLSMDVEYSFGKATEETGHGFSIELIGELNNTHAMLQLIDAGEYFPGYYNNTRYLNGSIQHIINKKIKLFTNFHEDESNAQRDTLYGVSPYSKYLVGGATLTYRNNDYLNIYIGARERKDRMSLQKFHYTENFSRISLVNIFNKFQTNLNFEFAGTKNIQNNTKGNSQKGALILRFKPSHKLNISTYIQYYNTFRYSEDKSQEIIYGGETSFNFNNFTSLNMSFQNAHNIEEYYRDRSLFDLRFSKYFKKQHQFELTWSEALKQKQVDNRDTYIGLKYTFHFGIPLKKTKDLGSLRGRLINNGVKDIANVALNLGGRIQVTDEDGVFVFNDIPAGEHYLYLDNTSLNFNDIPSIKMPMLVNITQNELNDIQIGLTKAASISGNVRLDFENLQNEKLTDDIPALSDKNVIVEIKLDDEIHRTIINLNEEFNFLGLRPGEWQLKVYHNSLGNNYTIKNSEMIINLLSGETSSVNIDVTKKARRIRFQPTKIIIN